MTTGPSIRRAAAPILGGMELPTRGRRAALTALALLLAAESVATVTVAASSALSAAGQAAAPAATAAAAPPVGRVLAEVDTETRSPAPAPVAGTPAAPDAPDDMRPRPALAPATPPAPTAPPAAAPKPAATPAPRPPAQAAPTPPRAVVYQGRNRVWIPSLGVNLSVSWFACDRATPPGNLVYRWGCAGSNNVYLLGHAASVFRPLYSAYTSGRLKVGMRVVYADGSGTVRTYAVQYWRVVRPDGDVDWAYAAQSAPSMTLQTCVGTASQYRLVVRLVQVG